MTPNTVYKADSVYKSECPYPNSSDQNSDQNSEVDDDDDAPLSHMVKVFCNPVATTRYTFKNHSLFLYLFIERLPQFLFVKATTALLCKAYNKYNKCVSYPIYSEDNINPL